MAAHGQEKQTLTRTPCYSDNEMNITEDNNVTTKT